MKITHLPNSALNGFSEVSHRYAFGCQIFARFVKRIPSVGFRKGDIEFP